MKNIYIPKTIVVAECGVFRNCAVNKADEFARNYPNFEKLYEKNGYVFWVRKN